MWENHNEKNPIAPKFVFIVLSRQVIKENIWKLSNFNSRVQKNSMN